VNLVVARGLYTAEYYISTRQVAFTSAFANNCFLCFLPCAKHLRMRCTYGGAYAR
jgi:hypothetical protein